METEKKPILVCILNFVNTLSSEHGWLGMITSWAVLFSAMLIWMGFVGIIGVVVSAAFKYVFNF